MATTSSPTSLAACGGAVTQARSDGLVVAEHAHDARADLRLGAWHGTMNYAGFTRPVWTWLRGENLPSDPASGFIGLPVGVPRLPGESTVRDDARVPRGHPLDGLAALVGDPRQPRLGALPGRSRAHASASSSASACR